MNVFWINVLIFNVDFFSLVTLYSFEKFKNLKCLLLTQAITLSVSTPLTVLRGRSWPVCVLNGLRLLDIKSR